MQQQPIHANTELFVVFTGCESTSSGDRSKMSSSSKSRAASRLTPPPPPLPSAPAHPFVSFVIVTRNDSPRVLHRLCRSLRALTADAVRFALNFEIVIVDWNSVASQPGVAAAMRSTCVLFLPVRVIVVPPYLHDAQPNPMSLQVILLTAKNVGARRARGSFIVFTNADDIFPPKLLLQLSPATLQRGRVYRAMRWEVHAIAEPDAPVDYSAFFSAWANIDAPNLFSTQTEQSMIGIVKFLSHGMLFEVNPKWLCALKIFQSRPHTRDMSDSRCPNLEGAAALCDRGVDPALLDAEQQKLLTDASGDFIAVAAEDFRRQRGAIQLAANRHEDSLMLYVPASASQVFVSHFCHVHAGSRRFAAARVCGGVQRDAPVAPCAVVVKAQELTRVRRQHALDCGRRKSVSVERIAGGCRRASARRCWWRQR